jgi:uncharacterized protein
MTSAVGHGFGETSELSAQECLHLLATGSFGRLAVGIGDGVPAIRPLRYAFDERSRSIVSRIGDGSMLHAVSHDAKAAFEIDEIDERARTGWSVIVTGVARLITDPAEIRRLQDSSAVDWPAEEPTRWVALRAQTVSGRRISSPRSRLEGFAEDGIG